MADISLQTQGQQDDPPYEIKMAWAMRWFFARILGAGYLVSIVAGILGFTLTKNPYYLAFLSPTALTPVVFYLVPMDERRYQLKLEKIRTKAQKRANRQTNKKQLP